MIPATLNRLTAEWNIEIFSKSPIIQYSAIKKKYMGETNLDRRELRANTTGESSKSFEFLSSVYQHFVLYHDGREFIVSNGSHFYCNVKEVKY